MVSRTRIQFFAVVFMLGSVLGSSPLSAREAADNSITIVYNNIPGDSASRLQIGGGFSAFIVFRKQSILFDVGGDASTIMNNIKALDLDLRQLDAVTISHNHWDHVYGLPGIYTLLESNPKVYAAASSKDVIKQQYPHADVVRIDEPGEILPGVWSTGAITTEYRDMTISEQSLILDAEAGLYVITGCAHPGIVNIIERVRQLLPEKPIELIAGGFHLVNTTDEEIRGISTSLRRLDVKSVAPSHCTGRHAMEIFEKEWRDQYIRLYLGDAHRF